MFYLLFVFKKPLDRKYRTINGVAPRVMLIRTGANTLCTAYAITKLLASKAMLFFKAVGAKFICSSNVIKSIPLKRKITAKIRFC